MVVFACCCFSGNLPCLCLCDQVRTWFFKEGNMDLIVFWGQSWRNETRFQTISPGSFQTIPHSLWLMLEFSSSHHLQWIKKNKLNFCLKKDNLLTYFGTAEVIRHLTHFTVPKASWDVIEKWMPFSEIEYWCSYL